MHHVFWVYVISDRNYSDRKIAIYRKISIYIIRGYKVRLINYINIYSKVDPAAIKDNPELADGIVSSMIDRAAGKNPIEVTSLFNSLVLTA